MNNPKIKIKCLKTLRSYKGLSSTETGYENLGFFFNFFNISNKYSKSEVLIQNSTIVTAVLSFVGKLRIFW